MTTAQIIAIISLLISFGVSPIEAKNVQTILENAPAPKVQVVEDWKATVTMASTTVKLEEVKEETWSEAKKKTSSKACILHGCINKAGQITH